MNKDINFDDIDATQIGVTVGVVGGLIWGIKNKLGFGQTALYALLLGAAGAFIGSQYKTHFGDEKDKG